MPPSATEEDRVENRLADEPSPYLRQHRTNPVDWYPWGEDAFEKARSEEKPIFLSIGYSSCHWCHVMAHESFEDGEIAEILNEHFVSIKVDREERPDVDGLYMEFVQRATGQGGWPLSVFLLPDGRPFYGGTYFPPEDRYGTPGFKNVVNTLAEHWEEDRERLLESAEEVAEGLQVDVFDRSSGGEATEEVLGQAVSALAESFDPRNGGFGEAPKFPQPMVLSFLLREYHRTGDLNARQMALTTLDAMARGGIYDHLGGGFHRYATDAEWLVPHFEKMGYDNALLAGLYLEAYQLTGEEGYRSVVEETLAFVERSMRGPEGGIFTALDADSEGEEGKYYVWTYEELLEELKKVVGAEAAEAVAAYFGARPEGNWEGTNILHRPEPAEAVADRFDCSEEELEAYAAEAADHLREKRSERPAPGLDDKVLTAWNGMMITSFARAAEVLGEERYRETAVETAEFLFDRLYDEEADQLYRAYREGQVRQEAFVEDYAYLAEALVALYETTGTRRWLERAGELADEMVEEFADTEHGGFFLTRSDTELIARRKEIMDNAMPSGNSKAVQVLLRLATLLGREDWAEQARRTLDQLAPAMERHPVGFGGLLQGVQEAIEPYREIVLVGPDRAPFTEMLRGRYEPFRLLVQADGPEGDDIPLLEGRSMEEGRTTAYLCENYSCRLPVTDPEALIDQLEERAERS